MAVRYKFIELSVVTDDALDEVVNHWVGTGWSFDGIRFVTTEASRRPTMAFVSFIRDGDGSGELAAPIGRAVGEPSPIVRRRVTPTAAPAPIELGELDLGAPDDDS